MQSRNVSTPFKGRSFTVIAGFTKTGKADGASSAPDFTVWNLPSDYLWFAYSQQAHSCWYSFWKAPKPFAKLEAQHYTTYTQISSQMELLICIPCSKCRGKNCFANVLRNNMSYLHVLYCCLCRPRKGRGGSSITLYSKHTLHLCQIFFHDFAERRRYYSQNPVELFQEY